MTTLAQELLESQYSGITSNFSSYNRQYTLGSWHQATADLSSSLTSLNLPVERPVHSVANATIARSYVDDFYYRIWFSPDELRLGNIAGNINRTVTVWNAFFDSKQFASITENSLSGVSHDAVAPQTLPSLSIYQFTVSVSTEGSSTLDGYFGLTIDGVVYQLPVIGSRVTPFLHRPDGEIIRSFRFQTHVKASKNNTEQRQRISRGARELLSYDVAVIADQKREFENLLYNWQSRVFAVPIWFEGQTLQSSHAAGATTINCDTDTYSFYADYPAVIENGDTVEIVEVTAVSANSITINFGLQNEFPEGSRLYPATMSRLGAKQNLVQFDGESSIGRFTFVSAKTRPMPTDTFTTYRGAPIFPFKENWDNVPEWVYERKIKFLDNGRSEIKVDDQSGVPTINRNIELTLENRSQIFQFLAFLNDAKGRYRHFWIDHRTNDFEMVDDVLSSGSNMNVKNNGYSRYVGGGVGKRDIVIELTSGTLLYRRIESSVEIDATKETLALDQTFGQDITTGQIRRISFLTLVRQQSDQVDVRYFLPEVAIVQYGLKGVTDDI